MCFVAEFHAYWFLFGLLNLSFHNYVVKWSQFLFQFTFCSASDWSLQVYFYKITTFYVVVVVHVVVVVIHDCKRMEDQLFVWFEYTWPYSILWGFPVFFSTPSNLVDIKFISKLSMITCLSNICVRWSFLELLWLFDFKSSCYFNLYSWP